MKIEVGKWYRDSAGLVVKITDGFEGFFTGNSGRIYNRHGCTASDKPANLMVEVPELSLGDWFVNEGRVPEADVTAVMFLDGDIASCGVYGKDGLDWLSGGGSSDIVAYCTSPWEVVKPAPERSEAESSLADFSARVDAFREFANNVEKIPAREPVQFTLDGIEPPTIDMTEPGYETLADVLQRAYDQAAKGKGKERHARGEPFDEQVMQQGAQRFGVGSLLFQAFKKSEESQRLQHDRAINELLGAIVYLAGAVIALEKGKSV